MSIPSTINSIEEHIENAYDALALGGEDLTNIDKNLTNINLGLKNRYEDFLANGTDELWNNWENKNTQEGANLHFDNTIQAKMQINLKGNTEQNSAPTPDNPVDIKVVTGDNTIYFAHKNFANINNFVNTENSYRKIVVSNGTVEISNNTSSNGYADSNKKLSAICPELKAGQTVYLNIETTGSKKIAILTSPSTTWKDGTSLIITEEMLGSKIIIYGGYNTTTTISNLMISPQNDKNFEPYIIPTTQLLSLGNIELCKIGDYQDYIWYDENNDKWYKHKVIDKYTFNGTENWVKSSSGKYPGDYYIGGSSSPLKPISAFCQLICSHFKKANVNDSTQISTNFQMYDATIESKGGIIDFWFDDGTATLEEYKTWLSNNNVVLYYPTSIQSEIEITDTILLAQLNALYNLKSYNNQTNIIQTNDNLPFIINATALLKNA